jgi:TetR/AcrR family transcriptional regulator, cholesterol catabolism regulator
VSARLAARTALVTGAGRGIGRGIATTRAAIVGSVPAAGKSSGNRKTVAARTPRKREQEVIDAAVRVFQRAGYASARIQDVGEELGILKGSLYYYVSSKEELLYRVLESVHEDVDRLLQDIVASTAPPLERLEEFVRRIVAFNLENLDRISVYYRDAEQLSPERYRQIQERRKKHDKLVTELIVAAQQAGDADPSLDAKLLSNCLFGSLIWVYTWYRPRGGPSRAEVIDTYAKFILRGVVGGS